MGGIATGYQLDPTKPNYNADPTVTARDRMLQQSIREKRHALFRQSGYTKSLDDSGKEYDYRKSLTDAGGGLGPTGKPMTEEEWAAFGEEVIAGEGGAPLAIKENKKPIAPDLTDEFLQKARTSMAQRLQSTRGRSSTFSPQQMGSLDLSKPRLGSY